MSQTVITQAFEALKAQEAANGGVVTLDEFVFANVPDLNITDPIDRTEGLPPAAQIVHRQAISKTGMVNSNAVVYSVVLGADVGDFEFNWVGLLNKASGVVAMIVHAPSQKKIKTASGQQGNVLTRSFLMEYNGASQQTQIITPADTWQIDFTARLNGVDERIRLENKDIYGDATFISDGFKLTHNGGVYSVKRGVGYVAGIRSCLITDQVLSVSTLPIKVWVDVCWRGTLTSEWAGTSKIVMAETLTDYEENDEKHYVYAFAEILADGSVKDYRTTTVVGQLSQLEASPDTFPYFDSDEILALSPLSAFVRGMLGKSGADQIREYLDLEGTYSNLPVIEENLAALAENVNNSHRYKVLHELPLHFSAYDSLCLKEGYSYMYATGHAFDHKANELWVVFQGEGGDTGNWFVIYDLATLQEKTHFRAGKRWTKSFALFYSGTTRYLYSRSASTGWLARFDVTVMPAPGITVYEGVAPRNEVKCIFAAEYNGELLIPHDAPTTNSVAYSNTFNVVDSMTWAFKRSFRMDVVGAGNEYGAEAFIYKNQGTIFVPDGLAMAFGGAAIAGDGKSVDSDLRVVQGVVMKTEEGNLIKCGLFDPYKGMQILTAAGYTSTRFEHEGIHYDKTTNRITTLWHYTDDPAGKFLIVEAFSKDTDALDMASAGVQHRPRLTDVLGLFRSNFSLSVPVDPIMGNVLSDVTDILTVMNNYDLRKTYWYSTNFSTLKFNGAAITGSLQAELFRGTNATFFLELTGSGLAQKWQIQISGNTFIYTLMNTYATSIVWPTGATDSAGAGSPEGILAAPPSSTYRRRDGDGATLWYIKQSGTGNTGWAARG